MMMTMMMMMMMMMMMKGVVGLGVTINLMNGNNYEFSVATKRHNS